MNEPNLRRDLAEERLKLKSAVTDLRAELGQAADKGKKVGTGIGAATGAAIVLRLVLKLARRRGD